MTVKRRNWELETMLMKNLFSASHGCAFLELLGSLTTCLLQSIRIADHAIPQNVVTKFVNGLDELRSILKSFGASILKREHVKMQVWHRKT